VSETAAKQTEHMTVDEFLAWDGAGHIGKLELVEGRVRAMSPASGTHALVQGNLAGLLWAAFRARKSPCRVGTEAPISPRIHANDNVRAPDLAVTCAPVTNDKLFPEPVLIVEVLSPTNRRETWESIRAIASVPSLKEILVVDSEKRWAEIFRREADGSWPVHGQSRLEDQGTIDLESIGVTFSLADVYEGTHLAAEPSA
jgi:Uma2 family endonuclease